MCIYYGINKVYCFIEEKNGLLYDLIFLEYKIILNYEDFELKELNTLKNDSRTRIVLINSPSTFKINNKYIDLMVYLPISLYQSNNSFQFDFFDLDSHSYSVKAINQEKTDEELLIANILNTNKKSLINFYKKLEPLLKSQETNEEKYRELCRGVSLEKNIENFIS